MYNKAIWKYFFDINMYNLPFCLIFGLISGILWSVIVFSSFGVLIGFLGYQTFKKNEYYAYYNLGFTKTDLLKKVWIINLIISSLIFIIYITIK
jgi:hypothetical protein